MSVARGTCTEDECGRAVHCLDLCRAHYMRWYKTQRAQTPCKVSGCKRGQTSRGWCRTHYHLWRKYGSVAERPRLTTAERFWAKVNKDGPCPHDSAEAAQTFGVCWVWTAFTKKDGYAMFRESPEKLVGAHVWAWKSENGPVPAGLEIDHFVCDRRNCVRPSHLRAMLPYDNTMRSPKQLWRRTHCNHGHPFSGENLIITARGDGTGKTKRRCRTCSRRWMAEFKARQRSGAAATASAALVK